MSIKDLEEENKKEIERNLRMFLEDFKEGFEDNKKDFEAARNYKSGRAFESEHDNKMWDKSRGKVCVNYVRNYINSIVSTYNDNPFGVSPKQIGMMSTPIEDIAKVMEYVQVKSNFNDICAQVLKETLEEGQSYSLVYHKPSKFNSEQYDIVIEKLDNRMVITDAKLADNSDAENTIYVETISKNKAKKLYKDYEDYDKLNFRSDDILSNFDWFDDNTEVALITYYHRTDKGVEVISYCHNSIVDYSVLPIDVIPIVRCVGEDVEINKRKTWRGVIYTVADLLRTINFTASLGQERVALNPNINYLMPEEGVTDIKSLASVNLKNRSVLVYKSKDSSGQPVSPPVRQNNSVDLTDIKTSIDINKGLISDVLGQIQGTETKQMTAEEALLKKYDKETSKEIYLKNLKEFSKSLGNVVLQYIGFIFDSQVMVEGGNYLPIIESIENVYITVDDGPLKATRNERTLRQLMAFANLTGTNESFSKIAPIVIDYLDIEPNAKQVLTSKFVQDPNANVIPPEVQQQMVAKDQQIQQLTVQNQELSKSIASLQQALFEMQNDSKTQMDQTMAKIASAERMNIAKLQLEKEKFAMELQAKAGKLSVEVNEADKDRQLEAEKEFLKYNSQLESERQATREMASNIDNPLFTTSKFTS